MQLRDIGEFGLISKLMSGRPVLPGVIVPSGDDAAVVEVTSGARVVYTCDCMVEDVHFLRSASGVDVGYKLMASNVSDIAAMGGAPKYALVTLVAPPDIDVAWLEELYQGLFLCAEAYGVGIVGGDTSKGPKIVLNVSLLGEISPGKEMQRSLAEVGDLVCVTGPLGGSHAGLQVVLGAVSSKHPGAAAALARHYRPAPRVAEAALLTNLGCRCANDISDGLASEAAEIAKASGVRIDLYGEAIPISSETEAIAQTVGSDPVEFALYGGEDYELVFTLHPSLANELNTTLPQAKVIGVVTVGQGVYLLRDDSAIEVEAGFTHFK